MNNTSDFLRFTNHKNDFEPEELNQFFASFDFQNPEFLAWIEQNTAPYIYFQFYILLVKNYLNQQQNMSQVVDFILAQKSGSGSGYFIKLITEVQKKYPDILDLEQFEALLLQHFQQQDISQDFPRSLLNAYCLFYFHFKTIPAYLTQQVQVENKDLIYELVNINRSHQHDYGILDKLLEFTAQGHDDYSIFYDLKYWAEETKIFTIREKITSIALNILQNKLKDPSPYFHDTYLKALQQHRADTIEGYIDFCRYLPTLKTQNFLNQLIENQNLHIAIRFEAVLIYFLTFHQHHPLKQQITHSLLTLPLGQRWGSCLSNRGFVYDYDLFKQNEFFSLDEILLALYSTQWIYAAQKVLKNYSDDHQIQQKIIGTVLDALNSLIQRILNVNPDDYVTVEYIRYLISILAKYHLDSTQRQRLQQILLQGLQQFINHFTKQKRLHQHMIELIYGLGFDVPDQYFNLLGTWAKLEFLWKDKGLTQEQVWQYLIDAEVISTDAELDPTDAIFPQCLAYVNLMLYDERRSDYSLGYETFEQYFPHPIKWLEKENIETDDIIYFNQPDPHIDWKHIEYAYFEYQQKYYAFFIYSFNPYTASSFISIFNQILAYFNIPKAVYLLKDTYDMIGTSDAYFSAHPKKFAEINQIIEIPYHPSHFFIPEIIKTPVFLAIEDQYQKTIQAGGFISAVNHEFISIPQPDSEITRDAKTWLISMSNEMKKQALNHLSQDNFCEQAINIRNLFISLAWNMVYDSSVVNFLRKQYPLWENTRDQHENLNLKQRMEYLDIIFNEDDLAVYLTYPIAS